MNKIMFFTGISFLLAEFISLLSYLLYISPEARKASAIAITIVLNLSAVIMMIVGFQKDKNE